MSLPGPTDFVAASRTGDCVVAVRSAALALASTRFIITCVAQAFHTVSAVDHVAPSVASSLHVSRWLRVVYYLEPDPLRFSFVVGSSGSGNGSEHSAPVEPVFVDVPLGNSSTAVTALAVHDWEMVRGISSAQQRLNCAC